jgi:L-cysteine:1D-myo-inositol 2-amino-2-deoxy-alpha-D-glucopyranoside ligase
MAGFLINDYDTAMKSWSDVEVPQLDSAFTFPVLSLTNSSTGEITALKKKDMYRMYVCGITPYDATH